MAGIRQNKPAMLNDIRGCFGACKGELRKVVCFIWEFLPNDQVLLDLEVYGQTPARATSLLQKLVSTGISTRVYGGLMME